MREQKHSSISALAALLVFCVFAVGVLAVLLGGARAYRSLTARDAAAYNSRTSAQYLATTLRQASSAQAVSVGTFGASDALQLTLVAEGETYNTRIYCHDGWLMELFVASDAAFSPEDGEKIMPAEKLELSLENGLLTAVLTDADGAAVRQVFALRGEEAAG